MQIVEEGTPTKHEQKKPSEDKVFDDLELIKKDAKKVLVCGGAGFLGGHLIGDLLIRGYKVTCLDIVAPDSAWRVQKHFGNPNFKYKWKSVLDMDLGPEEGYVDYAVVLSAQADVPLALASPRYTFQANVMPVVNFLEVSRKLEGHQTRTIFMSSENIYGKVPPERIPIKEDELPKPVNPYGASKLAAEQACLSYYRCYGLPITVLRSATMFGPFSRTNQVIPIFLKKAIMNEDIPIEGDGSGTRDFNYVSNVVDAIRMVIEAPREKVAGEVFNVASGTETPILNMANAIKSLVKSKSKLVFKPWREGEQGLRLALDIKKIHDTLKYDPMIATVNGLRITAAWVLETLNLDRETFMVKRRDLGIVEPQ